MITNQIAVVERQLRRRRRNIAKWKKRSIYAHLTAELENNLMDLFLDWLRYARLTIENDNSETDTEVFRRSW